MSFHFVVKQNNYINTKGYEACYVKRVEAVRRLVFWYWKGMSLRASVKMYRDVPEKTNHGLHRSLAFWLLSDSLLFLTLLFKLTVVLMTLLK